MQRRPCAAARWVRTCNVCMAPEQSCAALASCQSARDATWPQTDDACLAPAALLRSATGVRLYSACSVVYSLVLSRMSHEISEWELSARAERSSPRCCVPGAGGPAGALLTNKTLADPMSEYRNMPYMYDTCRTCTVVYGRACVGVRVRAYSERPRGACEMQRNLDTPELLTHAR